MDLKEVREEYNGRELKEEDLGEDPISELEKWIEFAKNKNISYVNAANLATFNRDGFPESRIVLIKEVSKKGVIFFTNYESSKAQDIKRWPKVGMTIFWKELDRQIRFTGFAKKIDQKESEKYFLSRSSESKLSSISSPQSEIVTLDELKKLRVETRDYYPNDEYPCPPYWGGFEIKIETIEFWQGRPNRFHDRIKYIKDTNSSWKKVRLAP